MPKSITPINKSDILLYKIQGNDTLQSIAERITGAVSNFKYLAIFNNIEPPYIVQDRDTINIKAHGTGKFMRDWIGSDIIIPAGTIVFAPADEFTHYIRKYKTLSDTQLTGNMTETEEIEIEAIDYGEKYNVVEYKITGIEGFDSYPELHFINTVPLLNAQYYRVLEPGEYLLIPKSLIKNYVSSLLTPAQDFIDYSVLGSDILLVDGDIIGTEDPNYKSSDIATVAGVLNIKQALTHKLMTAKGSLELHPDYGSLLPWLIGYYNGPDLPEMIRVETTRTLLTDPRVSEVNYVNVKQENNYITIDYGVYLVGSTELVSDNLVFSTKK